MKTSLTSETSEQLENIGVGQSVRDLRCGAMCNRDTASRHDALAATGLNTSHGRAFASPAAQLCNEGFDIMDAVF